VKKRRIVMPLANGQKFTRRQFLKASGAVASVAVGAAALSSVACSMLGAKQAAKLRFAWGETSASQVDFMKATSTEWQNKTGVEVIPDVMADSEIFKKVQASIAAGDPYDMLTTGQISDPLILAQTGNAVPVTDLINTSGGGQSNYGPKVLFPWKNDVWWVPYDYNLNYLFIRTDVFKAKGLPIPKMAWTWDEFEKACKAVNDPPNMYAILSPCSEALTTWSGSWMYWANDVSAYDDNFNVALDSPQMMPKVVEALEFYKKITAYMPSGIENLGNPDVLQLFYTGKLAMAPYCGRMVHQMIEFGPQYLDKFTCVGWPSPKGDKPVTTHSIDSFMLVKGKNVDASKAFMKWFMEEKDLDFHASLPIHLFPPQKSMYNDPKWRNLELVKKYWDTAMVPQYELINTSKIGGIDIDGPWLDPLPGRVSRDNIFAYMAQKVVLKNMPTQQAIKEAAEDIRKLHKEYPPKKA
jgi:multiple sugar transport system substrate-binding protein